MLKHIAATGHKLCHCGGMHYPHRPGSPFCYQNRMAPARHAARAGATDEEVLDVALECVLFGPRRPYKGPCPI